jgi:hypothetical protein
MSDVSWLDSRHKQEINLVSKASRLALGTIWPPVQWYRALYFRGVKRLEHEADYSFLSIAGNKNKLYLHSPHMPSKCAPGQFFYFLDHRHYSNQERVFPLTLRASRNTTSIRMAWMLEFNCTVYGV